MGTSRRARVAGLGAHSWAGVHGGCPRPHPQVTMEVTTSPTLAVILTDHRTGTHHTPNLSASAVWLLLDGATPLPRAAAEIAEAFGLPAATATDHVTEAAQQFWDAGLLAGSPEPTPPPTPRSCCS